MGYTVWVQAFLCTIIVFINISFSKNNSIEKPIHNKLDTLTQINLDSNPVSLVLQSLSANPIKNRVWLTNKIKEINSQLYEQGFVLRINELKDTNGTSKNFKTSLSDAIEVDSLVTIKTAISGKKFLFKYVLKITNPDFNWNSFGVSYYLSLNSAKESKIEKVGENLIVIPKGSTGLLVIDTILIPDSLYGDMKLIVKADESGLVFEKNRINNFKATNLYVLRGQNNIRVLGPKNFPLKVEGNKMHLELSIQDKKLPQIKFDIRDNRGNKKYSGYVSREKNAGRKFIDVSKWKKGNYFLIYNNEYMVLPFEFKIL